MSKPQHACNLTRFGIALRQPHVGYFLPPFMRQFIVSRFRLPGIALLLGALFGCPLMSLRAQEAFKEPDFSKFPAESGPVTLEVWSWVSGLDKAAKLFEQAYPDIKVHVNNVGGGPANTRSCRPRSKPVPADPMSHKLNTIFCPPSSSPTGWPILPKPARTI